ncbi:hypothetical protein [Streptomyces sp. NPDC048473]|uniref:hypothetical protein n=1 Tax=unclassified Streptomyces TaxID=2593676 RepID=UPI003712795B
MARAYGDDSNRSHPRGITGGDGNARIADDRTAGRSSKPGSFDRMTTYYRNEQAAKHQPAPMPVPSQDVDEGYRLVGPDGTPTPVVEHVQWVDNHPAGPDTHVIFSFEDDTGVEFPFDVPLTAVRHDERRPAPRGRTHLCPLPHWVSRSRGDARSRPIEEIHARRLERASALGADAIETVVLPSDADGLRFALKHGFVEVERYLLPGGTNPWIT